MSGPRNKICAVLLASSAALAFTGCSRPDPNPPVRITGDKTQAIPSTEPTTTTSTTVAPSTTLYYSPGGPGQSIIDETTTTTSTTIAETTEDE